MKLKLETKSSTNILQISGEINRKSGEILKAGITKLLKDGKDKIVLDFSSVSAIEADFLKDLNHFSKIATELAGKIVLAGVSPQIQTEIQKQTEKFTFAIVDTVEEGIDLCRAKSSAKQSEAGSALAEESSESKLTSIHTQEIQRLRRELAAANETNRKLELQIAKFIKERRLPPDPEAISEKISLLERNIKEMSAVLQAGSNAKK